MQAATGDPGKTWPSFSSSSGGGGGGSGGRDGGGTESIMLLDVASHGGVRAAPNFRATLCDIWDGVAVAQKRERQRHTERETDRDRQRLAVFPR